MTKNLITIFTLSLFLISCGFGEDENRHTYEIDNPLNKDIILFIDDESYELSAQKSKKVYLDKGRHQLVFGNDTIWFDVEEVNTRTVLNPTRSSYVVFKQIAFSKTDAPPDGTNSLVSNFVLDGEVVMVPFTVTRDLFVRHSDLQWTKGLSDKASKKDIKKQSDLLKKEDMPQSKIFRGNDFIEYLGAENFPAGFSFVTGESPKIE